MIYEPRRETSQTAARNPPHMPAVTRWLPKLPEGRTLDDEDVDVDDDDEE